MLITQKLGKPMKVIKCEHRFCLNCLAAYFSSGKNEEESQCPAFEINTLKADISSSSDLQTLLSLLKIQCNTCSKKFLISTHYNHYTKHIQNCSLSMSKPSSLLVTAAFNISNNNIINKINGGCHITRSTKENEIKYWKIFDKFKIGGTVYIGSIN